MSFRIPDILGIAICRFFINFKNINIIVYYKHVIRKKELDQERAVRNEMLENREQVSVNKEAHVLIVEEGAVKLAVIEKV